jgi:uncharacterized protein (TIGR00251 family)
VIITCHVKPGSRQNRLERHSETEWNIALMAPPVEGKANEALISFLAKELGVRKRQIEILSGFNSRIKRLKIELSK